MKRLLYLTQYYASADQPGASRHYQHIRHLTARGYKVTLITSYVKNRLRVIPPEYKGIKIAKEEEEGVTIYKTYAYPNYGRDFRTRMLNYLSFMLYSFIAGLKAPPCDLVFASSPSLFVGLTGLRIPSIVLEASGMIGEVTIPLAMIALGLVLSQKRGAVSRQPGLLLCVGTIRLLFMPAAAALALSLFPGMDPTLRVCLVLLAGMPCASSAPLFVERYGGDVPFAVTAVFSTTIAAAGTIPLWLLCLRT